MLTTLPSIFLDDDFVLLKDLPQELKDDITLGAMKRFEEHIKTMKCGLICSVSTQKPSKNKPIRNRLRELSKDVGYVKIYEGKKGNFAPSAVSYFVYSLRDEVEFEHLLYDISNQFKVGIKIFKENNEVSYGHLFSYINISCTKNIFTINEAFYRKISYMKSEFVVKGIENISVIHVTELLSMNRIIMGSITGYSARSYYNTKNPFRISNLIGKAN